MVEGRLGVWRLGLSLVLALSLVNCVTVGKCAPLKRVSGRIIQTR